MTTRPFDVFSSVLNCGGAARSSSGPSTPPAPAAQPQLFHVSSRSGRGYLRGRMSQPHASAWSYAFQPHAPVAFLVKAPQPRGAGSRACRAEIRLGVPSAWGHARFGRARSQSTIVSRTKTAHNVQRAPRALSGSQLFETLRESGKRHQARSSPMEEPSSTILTAPGGASRAPKRPPTAECAARLVRAPHSRVHPRLPQRQRGQFSTLWPPSARVQHKGNENRKYPSMSGQCPLGFRPHEKWRTSQIRIQSRTSRCFARPAVSRRRHR